MVSFKELKEKSHSTSSTAPWREKLARFISLRITFVLLNIFPKVTPNQITVLMIIFGLISLIFFAKGTYGYILLGVLFYHLYLIFDACDGEIARFKSMYSKKGLYLDYMGHVLLNPLIIMTIAVGVFFTDPGFIPSYWFLIIGFITMYSMILNNFLKIKKYEMYIDMGSFEELEKMQKGFKSQDRRKNWFMDEMWQFFRIMTFNSVFLFGILNILPYLVLLNGIVFPLQMLKRFYVEVKSA
ncbi:CDP-alcohol phosphatidyltransferase family protein [Candidatus Pacearchaeota archaeon]|nr:CDP-alcohol phosphatidyltransferase family protein [Candidatus Pacearchaeota archaeon]